MGNGFKMAIAAAALALTASVAAPAIGADGEQAIKQRQDLMDANGKAIGVVKAYLQKGRGTAAEAAAAATKLSKYGTEMLADFPKGSGRGDFDPKKTRALAKIWEDWSGFEADAKAFSNESAKLATVLTSGDMEAAKAQFRAVGKTCGGCHKEYRGEKVR